MEEDEQSLMTPDCWAWSGLVEPDCGGLDRRTRVHLPHHLIVDAVNIHSITGSEGSSHLGH